MKKQYLKSTRRLFSHHIVRLLSISAIFVVSISLISGLYNVIPTIKDAISSTYHNGYLHDFAIIGTKETIDNVEKEIKNKFNDEIQDYERTYYFDIKSTTAGYSKRFQYFDINHKIDKLELADGAWPINQNEAVVNLPSTEMKQHNIGDKIEISSFGPTISFTITGIVKNPTMLSEKWEPSMSYTSEKPDYLDDVIYTPNNLIKSVAPNIMLLTLKNRNLFNTFSNPYKAKIDDLQSKFEKLAPDAINVQTLYQNATLFSLKEYNHTMVVLAAIFVTLFIFITILVVFSTMTRLIEEDRANLAVLKTLGYSNFAIVMRHLFFTLIAGLIGIAIAVVPAYYVCLMILNAFADRYTLPFELSMAETGFFVLAFGTLLICLIFIGISCFRNAKQSPIQLLTPRAPKPGAKILLEKIKPIWSRLAFKYKSTCRNIFRYKARFLMTVLSIIVSTVLVFAAFALLNYYNKSPELGNDPSKIICYFLLAFSAILCSLVIYNITNINISERTREIATLKVLGYRNKEVSRYIYREIYVLTLIGTLVGLPVGVGFSALLFKLLNSGDITYVEWWSYIVTIVITFVFAVLSSRLLRRKIIKVDMNDSLKTLE